MGHEALVPEGLGIATGLSLFAFSGHATFPELYRAMPKAERPKFFLACDVGFGAAGLAYARPTGGSELHRVMYSELE